MGTDSALTNTEDDGKDDSESNDDSPRARVAELSSTDTEAVRYEDTESDEKLVGGGEGTSDSLWSRLGLVQRDGGREGADS